MSIHERARSEAEKRASKYFPTEGDPWKFTYADGFKDGFLAGHEAATRTREVTAVAELDALPVGSVVLEGDGPPFPIPTVPGVFHRFPREVWGDSDGWFVVAGRGGRKSADIALPARVLYEPEETP